MAVLIDGQKAAAVTTMDYIKDLPRTHPNEMKHKYNRFYLINKSCLNGER